MIFGRLHILRRAALWGKRLGGVMRYLLREVDIPPLWLGLAVLAAWLLSWVWAVPGFAGLGVVLMALGLGLMLAAVVQMLVARTTPVPRRGPRVLVTGGLFRLSRNPIYLGDAIVLTGVILYLGAVLALPLVPAFMVLITRRYIVQEEAVLRAQFGAEFQMWTAQTGRWFWRF
jgi:protein-S-isoprenylcysteine O-methyltransferase Ste14